MKAIEMESNGPVLAKKVWSMVRVIYFMLRKGILKGKVMMDLNNIILKRRNKAISHNSNSHFQFSAPREYEFSCSNTPNNPFFFPTKRHHHRHFFACVHAPSTRDDDAVTVNAMKAVLDMLNNNNDVKVESSLPSPALPGFGRSPMVKQLRVTDSPFPLRDAGDNDHQVDKAAEEFIKRFYKDLKKQD